MGVALSWAAVDGALLTVGSRRSAIEIAWRMVPEADRTPVRRRLIIAVVDHVREHRERTGELSPRSESDEQHDAMWRLLEHVATGSTPEAQQALAAELVRYRNTGSTQSRASDGPSGR